MITRRNLLWGASAIAIVVAVGGIEALTLAQPAAAQSADRDAPSCWFRRRSATARSARTTPR